MNEYLIHLTFGDYQYVMGDDYVLRHEKVNYDYYWNDKYIPLTQERAESLIAALDALADEITEQYGYDYCRIQAAQSDRIYEAFVDKWFEECEEEDDEELAA